MIYLDFFSDNDLVIRRDKEFGVSHIGYDNYLRIIDTPDISLVNIQNYERPDDGEWERIIIDPYFKDYKWPFPKDRDKIIYDKVNIIS